MEISETKINGVLVIKPDIYRDERGFFSETFSKRKYIEMGISTDFVQDNLSLSTKNTLRGLHFQLKKPQGKLVRVTEGKVLDVVVDIRKESPSFGEHLLINLDDIEMLQLYIPPGLAHGFYTLSDSAIFEYKCTEYYYPNDQYGLIWSDPTLNIKWPSENPIVSEQDKNFPKLKDFF